jgi:hypothetical protein
VRKGLLGVAVTAQTLGKAKPEKMDQLINHQALRLKIQVKGCYTDSLVVLLFHFIQKAANL